MISNKKGIVDVIIIFGIVLILSYAGTVLVIDKYDIKYIGNKENKNLYDIKICPSIFEDIKKEDIETFHSLNEAEAKGYSFVNGCGK